MADEPKAPRKRAAKKAVDGESKKVSKKAAAIPVPLFQAAPTTKTAKVAKAAKVEKVEPVAASASDENEKEEFRRRRRRGGRGRRRMAKRVLMLMRALQLKS